MKANNGKMNELRKNGPETVAETRELASEDLEKTSGGTAFTAGGYNFNYRIHHPIACPKCLKDGEFTGNEQQKEYLFGLFSKTQGQFHCRDCNETWWASIDK